jgi:hypothetical protein
VEEARFCSESVSEHESAVKPEWASSAWFTPSKRQRGAFQYLGLLPMFGISVWKAVTSMPFVQEPAAAAKRG